MQFLSAALDAEDPFAAKVVVDEDALAAVRWMASSSDQEIMEEREMIVRCVEELGREVHASGEQKAWLSSCDAATAAVAASVNGPLLENVANEARHADADSVDLLRYGSQLYGLLPRSGLGPELHCEELPSAEALRTGCEAHNKALLAGLKADPHSAELLRCTMEDAARDSRLLLACCQDEPTLRGD